MTKQTPKIDKDRIILMTRLAVYDKHTGERDKRVNDYYLHDYIGKCNLQTHIAVVCGCIILAGFYMLDLILNKGQDLMTIDYPALGRQLGIYCLIILAFYTVIGTIQSTARYHKSRKRIEEYKKDLHTLDGVPKEKTKAKKRQGGGTGNLTR